MGKDNWETMKKILEYSLFYSFVTKIG